MTHEFTDSSAVLRDNGGTLGQFSASTALVIEDCTTATEFFTVHIIGSSFKDKVSGGAQDDTLDGADGDDSLLGQAGSARCRAVSAMICWTDRTAPTLGRRWRRRQAGGRGRQ